MLSEMMIKNKGGGEVFAFVIGFGHYLQLKNIKFLRGIRRSSMMSLANLISFGDQ
jgi:hypothetical protein